MFKDASDDSKEAKNELKELPDEIVDDDGVDDLPDELTLDNDDGAESLPDELTLYNDEKSDDNGRDKDVDSESENQQSDYQIEASENPHTETREGETYYYDDNGQLYRVGNELAPNSEYEINGYKYETDEKGRIVSAEGTLHLKNREGRLPIRDSIDDIGKGDQMEGDDRGHLIGDQFDGSNGLENMIPQDAGINRNDYKNFENELANAVREGKEVNVKNEPIYEGDSHRPVATVVTYSIDGEESVRVFPNGKEENR